MWEEQAPMTLEKSLAANQGTVVALNTRLLITFLSHVSLGFSTPSLEEISWGACIRIW